MWGLCGSRGCCLPPPFSTILWDWVMREALRGGSHPVSDTLQTSAFPFQGNCPGGPRPC